MDRLNKVCWKITRRCNLKCSFCFAGRPKDCKELDLNHNLSVLKKLKEKKIKRIGFSGGEPLLYNDFPELLTACVRLKIKINICTNATLINNKWASLFKKLNVGLAKVSLHGPKHIHNKLVGSNSFDSVLNRIRRLEQAGVPVGINCILSKENVQYIDRFIEDINKLKLEQILFQFVFPLELGSGYYQRFALGEDEKSIISRRIKSAIKRSCPGLTVKFNDFASYKNKVTYLVLESDGTLIDYYRSNRKGGQKLGKLA